MLVVLLGYWRGITFAPVTDLAVKIRAEASNVDAFGVIASLDGNSAVAMDFSHSVRPFSRPGKFASCFKFIETDKHLIINLIMMVETFQIFAFIRKFGIMSFASSQQILTTALPYHVGKRVVRLSSNGWYGLCCVHSMQLLAINNLQASSGFPSTRVHC